ncbi:MAG: hypothetical protein ACJAVK_000971 [Akkermansiaceae bacterium]|jgi:hypothetical protein
MGFSEDTGIEAMGIVVKFGKELKGFERAIFRDERGILVILIRIAARS